MEPNLTVETLMEALSKMNPKRIVYVTIPFSDSSGNITMVANKVRIMPDNIIASNAIEITRE
jgi:hypothetical protein